MKKEVKSEDRVLNEARKQALKKANVNHIFGKSYNVSVESGKVILARKKA